VLLLPLLLLPVLVLLFVVCIFNISASFLAAAAALARSTASLRRVTTLSLGYLLLLLAAVLGVGDDLLLPLFDFFKSEEDVAIHNPVVVVFSRETHSPPRRDHCTDAIENGNDEEEPKKPVPPDDENDGDNDDRHWPVMPGENPITSFAYHTNRVVSSRVAAVMGMHVSTRQRRRPLAIFDRCCEFVVDG
jgi:hypothetical protein